MFLPQFLARIVDPELQNFENNVAVSELRQRKYRRNQRLKSQNGVELFVTY